MWNYISEGPQILKQISLSDKLLLRYVANKILCILLYLHKLHETGWQEDDDKEKL